MNLIEFKVSIVAPEGELSNERMDIALAVARKWILPSSRAWVESELRSESVFDGFRVEVEVTTGSE